jgi:NADPH:quinone reductase-like Zn-dependent oxidoreductase
VDELSSVVKNARVVITSKGGPEVLKYVEDDLPAPATGQVGVKVLATGVAYADVLMRHGLYPKTPPFPFAPGYDIVGDIDALGPGVTQFALGQRVAALTMTGGYAQYTLVPAAHLVPVPDQLDPAEAVSLVLNYVTAYQMLHRFAKLHEGQRLLVHGAAGGVGTAALQLGKIAGLVMFGTASKSKHELVTSLGATPIDYRSENFVERITQLAPGGVDCVLDPIGGKNWLDSYRCLRAGGTLACYGASSAVAEGKLSAGLGFATLGLLKLIPDGKRACWYNIKTLRDTHPGWFRDDLSKLFILLRDRKIQPVIAAKLPLREAARANDMLEKAQVSGKIVLLPQE